MRTISVVTPCYNEEQNVEELYRRVKAAIAAIGGYRYEHIFIDNASRDNTVAVLRQLAAQDKNVKVIVNTRNFGHVRSPMHALQQASGDAVVGMASDLQDPPELIPQMVRRWEDGTPVVIAVKTKSAENRLTYWLRTKYYRLVQRLSGIPTYEHFTGFGLYDRSVMEMLKQFHDPYPYFRGIIAEIGLPHAEIPFYQPRRKRGIIKNNFYTLYDRAMLAITNLSKVPLRLVTWSGFLSALVCLLVSLVYLIYKLLFWYQFTVGVAPLVIGVFLFLSVQMMFVGIVGEYIGSILTFVQNRPLVCERERINFGPGKPLRTEIIDVKAPVAAEQ